MKKLLLFLISMLLPAMMNIYAALAQVVWEPVHLPDSTKTYSIDFDSTGRCYIITEYGVYFSDDRINWQNTSLTKSTLGTLYINDNNTIYAGGYELWRSFDGGITWDSIFYYPWSGISSIITLGDSVILLGGMRGIFRYSESTGEWTHLFDTHNVEIFYDFARNSEGTLFCGSTAYQTTFSPGGIRRSFDNGLTWEMSNLDYYFVSSLAINSNDEIYAGVRGQYYTGESGVFKSDDGGDTWYKVFNSRLISKLDINQYDEISIGCDDQGPPGGGIFYSSDNGFSWNEITNNLYTDNIQLLKYSPGSFLFVTTRFDDSLFRSQTVVDAGNNVDNVSGIHATLFPNPATDILTISINNDSKLRVLTITNLASGKQIVKEIVYPGVKTIKEDVSSLAAGVYLLSIAGDNYKMYVGKFIKY